MSFTRVAANMPGLVQFVYLVFAVVDVILCIACPAISPPVVSEYLHVWFVCLTIRLPLLDICFAVCRTTCVSLL